MIAPMLITDTTRPDASVLAGRIAGDAYGPADAGYDEHRIGFIASVDLRPAIVALPESAADVQAIVDYAREHGLRVAPQATGHNAHPLGDLSNAILLKTSRMRGVQIDAERKVARDGPGLDERRAFPVLARGLVVVQGGVGRDRDDGPARDGSGGEKWSQAGSS